MPTAECGFENSPAGLLLYGPTLPVQIGFDPEYRLALDRPPDLPTNPYPALVDTGATASCIDSALAVDLKLPVVDRRSMAGVGGKAEFNIHLAQIYIPLLDFTIRGGFAGVHLIAGGQPHYALIGRTFLRYFRMTYDGRTGVVTLSND